MEGTLVITLKDGQLSVNGPIDNAVLCYGLLQAARDVIFMRAMEAAQKNRIVPATIVPMVPKN